MGAVEHTQPKNGRKGEGGSMIEKAKSADAIGAAPGGRGKGEGTQA